MPAFLLVMFGGAVGAGLRYGVGLALPRVSSGFPWGTFVVNLVGGLCAGLLLGLLLTRGDEAEPWRLFLGVGLLSGFTTFSAFTAETYQLVQNGDLGLAFSYVTASVVGALGLLIAGLWLARTAA